MKREDNLIYITTDDGKELEGEIQFSFEVNGDEFVLYTINDVAYVAKVDDNNNLAPVEEDEWPLVEKVVEDYLANEEDNEDEGNELKADLAKNKVNLKQDTSDDDDLEEEEDLDE